jgi:hypothetical protein
MLFGTCQTISRIPGTTGTSGTSGTSFWEHREHREHREQEEHLWIIIPNVVWHLPDNIPDGDQRRFWILGNKKPLGRRVREVFIFNNL